MTKDEALKMAIEYIESGGGWGNASKEVINACKEALEQPNNEKKSIMQPEIKLADGITVEEWHELREPKEQPAQDTYGILEELSDLEHQQWIKWAKSIIDSEPISESRKQRWLTMMVDYKDLPDNIKEYDREWARKVMALYTHPAPQPAQEPVDYANIDKWEFETPTNYYHGSADGFIPLYTHPYQFIGLTDDEIESLIHGIVSHDWAIDFARAIEQALKEKNHD